MSTQNIKTRKAYRQGELLFVPLCKDEMSELVPDNNSHSSWKKLQTNILREGEATGHKHQVITQTPDVASILAPAGQFIRGLASMAVIGSEDRMLVATKPVEVVHPEHKPLSLPEGNYLVIVQREYDEIKARRILD
jgi:hypothetical protein